MLSLTRHWRSVAAANPVKEHKVPVYALAEFDPKSASRTLPFRFCQQCREEDLKTHGMTYWHRLHNLPGVDVCPTHHVALHQASRAQAHSTPNPATLDGERIDESLIEAQADPVLARYRNLARRVIQHEDTVRYAHAHEQLVRCAIRLGLCEGDPLHVHTHQQLERTLPGYMYCVLPAAWLNHHFSPDYQSYASALSLPPDRSYHEKLRQLAHPNSSEPAYLLLALAATVESDKEACNFLFDYSA